MKPCSVWLLAAWTMASAAAVSAADGPAAAPAGDKTGSSLPGPFAPPIQPWFAKAPPLPEPAGPVVRAATVDELYRAVNDAKPGSTILVADGHYFLPRYLVIRADNVTLRGQSGRPERVILDGARCSHTELVGVSGCSGVTIAHLTIQNVRQNGFKLNCDTGATKVTIYNCISRNVWQRHVKGVAGPVRDGRRVGPAGCRIQYCLFYNERAKRLDDEPYEKANPEQFRGNYVGGIDAMNAVDWVISDNVFIGIRGATGEARGAVFVWNGSAGVVIERNIVIDCDSGICLGNSHRAGEWEKLPHCDRFVVRNNFVTRCPESNILAAYTRDCLIAHNTVHDPTTKMRRLLRVVHDNDGLVVRNNLFSGPGISVDKQAGKVDLRDNLVRLVTEYFVDADKGNLHLTARAADAIDKAVAVEQVADDIDRQKRTGLGDLGADEFTPP